MLPHQISLVKYNSPILVSTTKDKANQDVQAQSSVRISKKGVAHRNILDAKRKSAQLFAAEPVSLTLPKPTVFTGTYTSTPTEDILNSILPPREWTESNQLWVQYVSSNPATRLDVVNLQSQLDQRLSQRQARETGICPIREELYAQCFDELIRQITINCSERGLLLLRVRDEARMTIAAYQTLYESSIAFGMRKALTAEQLKLKTETEIQRLDRDNRELTSQIEDLSLRCDAIQRREEEKKSTEERKHREQVDALQAANDQLKANLDTILSAPR